MPNELIGVDGTSATGLATIGNYLVGANPATPLNGIVISSVSYTGSAVSTSVFDSLILREGGPNPLAFGNGVLITSGDGTPARTDTSNSFGLNTNLPGSAELTNFARAAFPSAGETFDATILTLVITVVDPAIRTVRFDVAFGSDEYPEFSNSSFVDIAAISRNGVNYALINNNPLTPLSVVDDNLTLGNFVNNEDAFARIEYDGIINLQSIYVPVELGANVILLAVADTGDHIYDSGLFILDVAGSIVPAGGAFQSKVGTDGPDTLNGNGNNEEVIGGGGNDIILPALGVDIMTGGTGTDSFQGGPAELNGDFITDFEAGETIVVTGMTITDASFKIGIGSIILQFDTNADLVSDTFLTIQNDPGNGTFVGSASTLTFTALAASTAGADVVSGTAGNNWLSGLAGNDTLSGLAGNDGLAGGDGDDSLDGGDGDDTLAGGLGNDTIVGGAGADTVNYAGLLGPVAVNLAVLTAQATGAGGTDTISGVEDVVGTSFADGISGDAGANVLIGGFGADSLFGGAGADTFFGTLAEVNGDTIQDLSVGDLVVLQNLTALTNANLSFAVIAGGVQLRIDTNADGNPESRINLNAPASSTLLITTPAAGATLSAAANGAGTGGVDTYTGDANANIYNGLAGADSLTGGDAADALFGGDDNDTLNGGAGNDALDGGAGVDTMIGGAGNDSYGVDNVFDVVTEGAAAGTDTVSTTLATYALGANVENLTYLGAGSFTGYGNGDANFFQGGAGAEGFIGFAGNDSGEFGAGADYAYGGEGADTFSGGAGVDILLGENGNDVLSGGADQDYLFGLANDDTLNGDGGVDVLIGDIGNDVINGGDDNDYIYSGAGNDTASGGTGADLFVMEAGADTVNGDDGDDFVYGGADNDTINGGAGTDILLGEAGNDIINPGLGVDYVFLGDGSDRLIMDQNASGVTVLFEFTAGGASADVLELRNTAWSTIAEVQANTFDTGNGYSIIVLDPDTQIWVIGLTPGALVAGDVVFA